MTLLPSKNNTTPTTPTTPYDRDNFYNPYNPYNPCNSYNPTTLPPVLLLVFLLPLTIQITRTKPSTLPPLLPLSIGSHIRREAMVAKHVDDTQEEKDRIIGSHLNRQCV